MEFEGEEEVLIRSRRYIEPASGFIRAQRRWRPHPQNQQVAYSKFSSGLDWESRLRYLEPTSGHWRTWRKHPLIPWPGTRPLPAARAQTETEWRWNADEDAGMRTRIRGFHQATRQTTYTLTLDREMGKKKRLSRLGESNRHGDWPAAALAASPEAAAARNFVPRKNGGDKAYRTPEYESDFYKKGSTRPVPVFGQNVKHSGVVIPLATPRGRPCLPYSELESRRRRAAIVDEVASLEKWRPATPLAGPGKDKEDSGGGGGGGLAALQTALQKGK